MNNKTYDILKDIAQIWLPAIAVFIIAIFDIWNLPLGNEISASIVAFDTLLGAVLKISSIHYYEEKGE